MADLMVLATALIPASVTLVGYWLKLQSDKRLEQEREQSDQRLRQQDVEEKSRLRLDAAMRAADLFDGDGNGPNPAVSASGLLALTELGHASLAVALLVDLWSIDTPFDLTDESSLSLADLRRAREVAVTAEPASTGVSTETAILVIDEALHPRSAPAAQLVAAELLCRNSVRLNPCQSLHWPAAIDGRWLPNLVPKAKLLLMEALVLMTASSPSNKNALRSLAVRLYGVWRDDTHNPRVRGCVGVLIEAILPALERLQYTEFMQARETVKLEEMQQAAESASPNPDGFLEHLVINRAELLAEWSQECDWQHMGPGSLATATN
jgi:hypothetical protein